MKTLLKILGGLLVAAILVAYLVIEEGERVTPTGSGTVNLDVGSFEALPLPDYAAKQLTGDYKSYLVEVEPGIKVHVLEVGSGVPLFLTAWQPHLWVPVPQSGGGAAHRSGAGDHAHPGRAGLFQQSAGE